MSDVVNFSKLRTKIRLESQIVADIERLRKIGEHPKQSLFIAILDQASNAELEALGETLTNLRRSSSGEKGE